MQIRREDRPVVLFLPVLGCECGAVAWCNVTVLVPGEINLKAELMSQYCSLQRWLMMDDGCCHFAVLCVPFSANGRRFIVYVLCASIFRLLFIDTEFQTLRLKAEDSSGRQHILTVKLKSKVRHVLSCTRTQFTVRTGSFSHWKLFIIKWNTQQLDVDLQPIRIQTGRLHQTHMGCSICW